MCFLSTSTSLKNLNAQAIRKISDHFLVIFPARYKTQVKQGEKSNPLRALKWNGCRLGVFLSPNGWIRVSYRPSKCTRWSLSSVATVDTHRKVQYWGVQIINGLVVKRSLITQHCILQQLRFLMVTRILQSVP